MPSHRAARPATAVLLAGPLEFIPSSSQPAQPLFGSLCLTVSKVNLFSSLKAPSLLPQAFDHGGNLNRRCVMGLGEEKKETRRCGPGQCLSLTGADNTDFQSLPISCPSELVPPVQLGLTTQCSLRELC